MALHTKKEFATLCNIPTNSLAVSIKRGNVIINDQELIDDQVDKNRYFLEKRKKNDEVKPTGLIYPGHKIQKIVTKETSKHVNSKVNDAFQLDIAIKSAELKKKEVDTRLALIKEEKLKGVLIPTELVKIVFKQHSASITTSFKNAIENLLIEISKTKNLNRNELAELRGKMIVSLNTAINDSVTVSKKQISNIITQFSEKRDVGEHD